MGLTDLRGRPIRKSPDGTLIDFTGRILGKEVEIESPAFDHSEFSRRAQAEDTKKGIANLVMSGHYKEAAGALLRELKKVKREAREKQGETANE